MSTTLRLTWSSSAVVFAVGVALPVFAQPAPPPPAPEAAAVPTDAAPGEGSAPAGAAWEDAVPPEPEPETAPTPTPAPPPPVVPAVSEPAAAPTLGEPAVRPTLAQLGSYQTFSSGFIGLRVSYIDHAGFDPFAQTDALPQFSVGIGRTLFAHGPASLAAGLIYDVGGTTASARGQSTSLWSHRLALTPEVRYHVHPRLFALVVPAIGWGRLNASLDESSTGARFLRRADLATFDLTAGAAALLYGKVSGEVPATRLWVRVDGGYGWASKADLELVAEDETGVPARVAPIDLGDLALQGPTFRLALMLSY